MRSPLIASHRATSFAPFALLVVLSLAANAQQLHRVHFYGHDASVGYMSGFAPELGLEVARFDPEAILRAGKTTPPASPPELIVLLWGLRGQRRGGGSALVDPAETQERFLRALERTQDWKNPPRIVAATRAFDSIDALSPGLIEEAPNIDDYLHVGIDRSNLRRLLGFLSITYLAGQGKIELPVEEVDQTGLYHPAHQSSFPGIDEFSAWMEKRRPDLRDAPRVLILTVSHHFAVRNRAAIDTLITRLEENGLVACADLSPQRDAGGLEVARSWKPDVILDTRHVVGRDEKREDLEVPFLQCATLRRMSIEEWRDSSMSSRSLMGLANAEAAGSIEPRVFNGTAQGGGFVGIEERIERIVERTLAWTRLRKTKNAEKRLLVSAGSLIGGTPDNKLLNLPRSLLALLRALKQAGYRVDDLPADPAALLQAWQKRATEGGPDELRRLEKEGHAVSVPAADYQRWYEETIPERLRDQVETRHGPAPGSWFVVADGERTARFVFPHLAFGNIHMVASGGLPPHMRNMKTIRRIMNENSTLTPSHNILAARYHAEELLRAHARVRFGSFALDLLLPRKVAGLSNEDWPEILAGRTPDIRPFSIAATTFAVPARRRASAVLIGHLTPPRAPGGLDDELEDLRAEIVKWNELTDGPLKMRFLQEITRSVRELRLDHDLEFELDERLLEGAEIKALALHLDRIGGEAVDGRAHVFGEAPALATRFSQLIASAGRRFLDALAKLPGFSPPSDDTPGDPRRVIREKARALVALMLKQDLSSADALRAAGVSVPDAGLPREVSEGLDLIRTMNAGYDETGAEIDNLLAALEGRFVPPGPSGPVGRNPSVVPTGRNLYFFNPEELPSRASWDLGVDLAKRFLERWKREHEGALPRRVALSLSTRGSMADYGVAESQALFFLGVRPIWRRGRVSDIELIPADELGRPRIDVFLETKHHYNDYLRSRAELLDRAVRLVCDLDEKDNEVRNARERIRSAMITGGMSRARAEILSRARLFAVEQGRFGSGLHDKLFEATGVWNQRSDLAEVYMAQHDHVFTLGAWNEKAPGAYRAQLAEAEVVLRTSSRHGALSGRAHYSGGNLAAAIEHLSGKRPGYFIADVRQVGAESIERADEMLRREMRAILFNRKWIQAMKDEGASGAARMASMSWKLLGWKINRPDAVDDSDFDELTRVYLRDSKGMALAEFFENHSPDALQEISKNLLEAARKEFWRADRATLAEIAAIHARSVIRHGERIDENPKLRAFVAGTLLASGLPDLAAEVSPYTEAADGSPPTNSKPESVTQPQGDEGAKATADAAQAPPMEPVRGVELVPAAPDAEEHRGWALGFGIAAIALLVLGALIRKGAA